MKFRHLGIPYAFTSILTLFASPVLAGPQPPPANVPTTGPTGLISFYSLLCNFANWFFAFLLVVAVFFILFAAYKFFTAGGDSEGVGTARRYVIYALVGVAVAILAKSLIFIVGDFLGVGSASLFGTGC